MESGGSGATSHRLVSGQCRECSVSSLAISMMGRGPAEAMAEGGRIHDVSTLQTLGLRVVSRRGFLPSCKGRFHLKVPPIGSRRRDLEEKSWFQEVIFTPWGVGSPLWPRAGATVSTTRRTLV
jgi:hypothetical protein